jgi:hypothetical protein
MRNLTPKYAAFSLCLAAMILACAPITRVAAAAPAGEDKADKAKGPATTSPTADQPGPNRFYGTISAVDANAKTFTVDNQTYSIVAETQMTKAADDKPATMADATVGETVRGSYTKSADGKLNVTKVRFGKKSGGAKSGGGKKKNGATQPAGGAGGGAGAGAGAGAAPKE